MTKKETATYDSIEAGEKAYDFLSPEWVSALNTTKGPEREENDPVLNFTIPDSPYGAVELNIWGTRVAAGHTPEADATVTMPYKYACGALTGQALINTSLLMDNILRPAILGETQIEGDYSMYAMVMGGMSNMANDIRASLRPITTPRTRPLMSQRAIERAAINADVERLGLQRHVRELDEQGYTVITPEESGVTTEMMDRALNCIVDRVEAKTGVRPDMEKGSTHSDVYYPVLWYMLFKDKAFQDMAANEHAMTLAAHLFGTQNFRFSQDDVLMKGPSKQKWGKQQLGLHLDMTPYGFAQDDPVPEENISVNALWLMTDFNEEQDGVTVFIPGTHNLRRWPRANVEGQENSVSIIAPRGSFVLWPGTTWHGALPRSNPGLRVAMTMQYCNRYAHPRNPYQNDVTDEILAQNPPRFARLMGLTDMSGWRDEGIYAYLNKLAQEGSQRYVDKSKIVPNSMDLESVLFTRKKKKAQAA